MKSYQSPEKNMASIWRSRLLIGTLGFAVGAGAGVTGSFWWITSGMKAASEVAITYYVGWESEKAIRQYMSPNHSVGMYALEHLIDVYEFYRGQDLRVLNKTVLASDLGLSYGRLAVLAEKAGMEGKAAEAISRAIAAFQEAGQSVRSAEEVKQIVQRFDAGYQKERQGAEPHKGKQGPSRLPLRRQ